MVNNFLERYRKKKDSKLGRHEEIYISYVKKRQIKLVDKKEDIFNDHTKKERKRERGREIYINFQVKRMRLGRQAQRQI